MTYKDCVFEEMCPFLDKTCAERCAHFKNKADVVEVVRCSQCKHKDDCAGQIVHTTRDYVLEQNISTYNKVDFCSYGERRETDE